MIKFFLNIILEQKKINLNLKLFSIFNFPNGLLYFNLLDNNPILNNAQQQFKKSTEQVYFVHANWMVGKDTKIKALKEKNLWYIMDVTFNEKISTKLCKIMNNNRTDKGSLLLGKYGHNYTTFYYSIFKNIQFNILRLFELGIGTNDISVPSNMGKDGRVGASLYGWSEFFVNSKIYGVDIDKNILFNTDRIKTFYCDQTKPNIINSMWNELELKEDFDIIIDDGLHDFNGSVCFFENSIHKLKTDGYYIIEDISRPQISLYNEILNKWRNQYSNYTFTLLSIPSNINFWDNTLLVIHYIK